MVRLVLDAAGEEPFAVMDFLRFAVDVKVVIQQFRLALLMKKLTK